MQSYIINLHQTVTYSRSFATMVPTLMTKTSCLWSMLQGRLLHPLERLLVMGIPVFSEGRASSCWVGVEALAKSGSFNEAHVAHVAGNAMSQIAVGAMLILALGISSGQQRAESVKSSSESDFDGKLVSDSDNEPQM